MYKRHMENSQQVIEGIRKLDMTYFLKMTNMLLEH